MIGESKKLIPTLRRALWIADRCAVAAGVLAVVAATDSAIADAWAWLLNPFLWAVTGIFAIELLVQAWLTTSSVADLGEPLHFRLAAHFRRPAAWLDIAAALALPLPYLAGLDFADARLVGVVWLLKLVRYSHGLALLVRVVRNAADSLISVILVFGIILVGAAVLAYLFEGESQPAQFGSIPRAMWWAIVTLTTTGYGDATPVTLVGRMLAGLVMVSGIGLFALFAGILASGFADELRRRDFLRNWELVAKIPFFRDIGADIITEVARLLRRRDAAKGQVIVRRGQHGESMYFIVSGAVEVQIEPSPIRLSENQFFGEMALITGAPRGATVVATERCILLELDVADFRQLAANRPQLAKVIADEAARRSKPKDQG